MKSNQATIPSVAIVDYGNYVFLRDTATDLINDGYPLHYIFSTDVPSPNYRSDNNSVGLINVSAGGPIQKDSIATRALQERRWGQLCAAALDEINPDSIVVANTPLLSQAVLRSWALSRGRR